MSPMSVSSSRQSANADSTAAKSTGPVGAGGASGVRGPRPRLRRRRPSLGADDGPHLAIELACRAAQTAEEWQGTEMQDFS